MRVLLVLLVLAPLASAQPTCVQVGCYDVDDRDGDGAPDWANAATSADHLAVLNLNVNRSSLIYEAAVTSEETVEPFHTVALVGYTNGTREGEAYLEVNQGDEETGELLILAWAYLFVTDGDGDGRADDAELRAGELAVLVRDEDGDGIDEVHARGLP